MDLSNGQYHSLSLVPALINNHRILKEYDMYKKEVVDQQLRVDKYTANGADEWDINAQVRSIISILSYSILFYFILLASPSTSSF